MVLRSNLIVDKSKPYKETLKIYQKDKRIGSL